MSHTVGDYAVSSSLHFTQQSVAMLSSVLRSQRAVEVNIAIMRAFVRLRELMASHKERARKLEDLEMKYDERFQIVFEAIRQLMASEPPGPRQKRRIGFEIPAQEGKLGN